MTGELVSKSNIVKLPNFPDPVATDSEELGKKLNYPCFEYEVLFSEEGDGVFKSMQIVKVWAFSPAVLFDILLEANRRDNRYRYCMV